MTIKPEAQLGNHDMPIKQPQIVRVQKHYYNSCMHEYVQMTRKLNQFMLFNINQH